MSIYIIVCWTNYSDMNDNIDCIESVYRDKVLADKVCERFNAKCNKEFKYEVIERKLMENF